MADNIFNTLSFTKWTAALRQQKMEDEIQRQRMEQVARLRDKLGRERKLREQADMLNDDDIEHLIKNLEFAGALNGGAVALAPATNPIVANKPVVAQPNNQPIIFGQVPNTNSFMVEIKSSSKKKERASIPQTIFNYNRRYTEMMNQRAQNPREIDPSKLKIYEFEYNRRNNVV